MPTETARTHTSARTGTSDGRTMPSRLPASGGMARGSSSLPALARRSRGSLPGRAPRDPDAADRAPAAAADTRLRISLPPPALSERRHRGLARRLVAVGCAAYLTICARSPTSTGGPAARLHPGRRCGRGRRHPPARRSRSRRRAIAGGARSRGTSGPSKLCERPPAGVGDPDAGDIERPAAGNDRVGSCGCKTGADQLGQHLTLEAVGQKDRLGAAVGGRVEQFERPAPVALGAAGSSPSGCRHLGTRAAALVADSLSPPDEVHNPAGGQSRSSAAGSSKRNSVAAN
jgi:hypothetical protein